MGYLAEIVGRQVQTTCRGESCQIAKMRIFLLAENRPPGYYGLREAPILRPVNSLPEVAMNARSRTKFQPNLLRLEDRLTPTTTVTGVTFDEGNGTTVGAVIGSVQRSAVRRIIVNFSDPVTFTGTAASAFTVHRSATSATPGPIGDVNLASNPNAGPTSSVTVTFNATAGLVDVLGSVVDGIYDLMIDAAQVTGPNGSLDGNNDGVAGGSYTNSFGRKFGDLDGSGRVTQADVQLIWNTPNPGTSLVPFLMYDNNNGIVDQTTDFVCFRNNFGLTP